MAVYRQGQKYLSAPVIRPLTGLKGTIVFSLSWGNLDHGIGNRDNSKQ
jgi:hypothetical protein